MTMMELIQQVYTYIARPFRRKKPAAPTSPPAEIVPPSVAETKAKESDGG